MAVVEAALVLVVIVFVLLTARRSPTDPGPVLAAAGLDPDDPALRAEAETRLRRRRRYDLVGRLTGLAAGLVPAGSGWTSGLGVFWLLAGAVAGRFVAQVVEVRRAAAGGIRVTHLLRPGLPGYARPASIALVHLVALTPALLALAWFTHPKPVDDLSYRYPPATDGHVLAVVGTSLGALALTWAAALVVLGLRRVAGSPAALALDDAFRLATLRDLAVIPLAAGITGALELGSVLSSQPTSGWLGSPAPSALAAAVALAAIVVDLAGRPRWQRLHAAA
jgi:hypothetical protein